MKKDEAFTITVLKEICVVPRSASTEARIRVVKFGDNAPSVDVRQFYRTKAGREGVGRGYALTAKEYAALIEHRPAIEAALTAAKRKAA
jgi:hypothetical protein